ncbi:DUF6538 domain-containing protein [Halomonas sp.]|uniref:DUF6538 domain-containing protein n=1 Tax=Halomonas sp. TaxID=1486246 RepID=UPI003A90933A
MAYGSYLSRNRHNSIFYARIIIPLALRSHFGGKREFRLSLRTPCKATAKRRAMEIWLSFQVVYDALRNGKSLNDIHIPYGALAALKPHHKSQQAHPPLFALSENIPIPMQRPPSKPLALKGLVLHYMKSTYRGHEFEVEAGCIEKEQAAIAKFMDDVDKRMGPMAAETSANSLKSKIHLDHKPFSEAADDYIELYKRNREYDKTLRASTFDKESRNVSFWKYYFQETCLHEIDINSCREAEQHCRNYPKNVDAKIAATMCRSSHDRPITGSQATKNRLLVLKNILEHARKYGWIETNPASVIDTTQRRSASEVDKHPFTIEELKLIFPGSSYGDSFTTRFKKRDTSYDCAKYWTPLIALLSGARLGEIIQLELDDIKNEDGIWFFDITTESSTKDSGKELKTKGSRRRVPIHSALIKIGLLDYVKQRREHPLRPTGLFDQYVRGAPGKGKIITEWFKGGPNGVDRHGKPRIRYGYLDRCGVLCRPDQRADGSSVSFHSFRHTFADAARRGKLPNGEILRDEDTRWILGHASSLMTSRYGRGKELSFLQSVVEAVQYPGIELSSIRWQFFQKKSGVSAVHS